MSDIFHPLNGLPMTRRSFIGSVLALAAAPAIVRIGSIMPVQGCNWHQYVREVIAYSIENDDFIARWDILSPGVGQYHVDMRLPEVDLIKRAADHMVNPRDNMLRFERSAALERLDAAMRHHNISPRSLVKLELPQGIDWARHLNA